MRRRGVLALAAAVAAGGGVAASRLTGGPPVTEVAGPGAVATVPIERTDLSTTRTMPGTLGYGAPRTVRAATGTVTWLPKPGAVIKRGRALYRNDDQPVVLFYGRTPLFRPLGTPGLTGRDVAVVLGNLRALGYRVDRRPELTAEAVRVIKRWQRDLGRPETGTINPADVVVLPGAVRVGQITAQLGDPAAEGVLTVTGRRKVVTVPVRVPELGGIRAGTEVRVELPGGTTVDGRVTGIGRAARPVEESGTAEVDVTVALATTAADLDEAPVQVAFPGEVRADVLAVPVAALLALREGGHAVQVAGGPLTAVETGMFAMGLVEITGDGLDEGTRVVTVS